jgi:hypothetical protein
VLGVGGKVVQVWCKVCTQIEGRKKLSVLKIDSLWKHVGRCKALVAMPRVKVGERYFLKINAHAINGKLYFAKGLKIVLQQVVKGATWVNLLLFEWLVIVITFTFIMQFIVLTRLFAIFFWHPFGKWKPNILLQLICLWLNWIDVLHILSWWMPWHCVSMVLDLAWCWSYFFPPFWDYQKTLLWNKEGETFISTSYKTFECQHFGFASKHIQATMKSQAPKAMGELLTRIQWLKCEL